MSNKVKQGNTVKVHYKGSLTENGEVFDSSEGREPLEFTVGQGMVIFGFDNGVLDMEIGEKKTLKIPCEEAYGQKNEEHIFEYQRSELPEDINKDISLGALLHMMTPDNQPIPVAVVGLTDTILKLDANHQLAGKDLTFEVELVEIVS